MSNVTTPSKSEAKSSAKADATSHAKTATPEATSEAKSPAKFDVTSDTAKSSATKREIPSLVFYVAPMSSATPVLNALYELGVPFQHVPVDITKGEQHTAAFRALNPNAKVPTLVVDGTPMFEACAIMQRLGDRFGVEQGLWPAFDDPKRLEAASWSTWAYVSFGAHLSRLNWSHGERVDPSLHHPAQAEHARRELDALLTILDGRLADRDHLLGDTFTLADLIVGGVVTYATYCDVSVEAHPNVKAWLARFHARPAFARSWAADS